MSIGGIVRVDVRGAQGPRGATGATGNGANPFPPISGEDADEVHDESYMPGDIRRYGIEPGDGIDHAAVNPDRLDAFLVASTLPGVTGFIPRGTYSFGLNLDSSHTGSRIHSDGARFTGIYHLIDGVTDVVHTGDWYTEDRIGITNEGSARIKLGRMHALTGGRGVHIVNCPDLDFELLHVESMAIDPDSLAAVWIENQGVSGCRGRIQVDDSPGNGAFVNGLDIDVVIDVRGYGSDAIDVTALSGLQGLTETQTELGSGIILHRCTGRAHIDLTQSNTSPTSDTYAVLIAETGVTATSSRHRALEVSGFVTVGDGNRGVCIGSAESQSSYAVANVQVDLHVRLRTANTLEAGYAGVNVLAPDDTADHYRRLTGRLEFSNFGAVQEFKATAVATAEVLNYTEVLLDAFKVGDAKGAGRMIQCVGTGGVLKGHINGLVVNVNASSTASPLIDIEGCTNFDINKADLRAAGVVSTTAVRFISNTDCSLSLVSRNFGLTATGAVYLDGNTRCVIGPLTLTRASIAETAIRFFNTHTDCLFQSISIIGSFAKGFDDGTSTVFTRCTAVNCVATGNTDDTDLTTAMFPAANQLGCTNFAV